MERRRVVAAMALAVSLGYWVSVQSVVFPPAGGPTPVQPANAAVAASVVPSVTSRVSVDSELPAPVRVTQPVTQATPDAPTLDAPSKSALQAAASKLGFDPSPDAAWRGRLYTPTYLTRIRNLWFIVDCWHNRVVYSPDLDRPIERWRDLVGVASSRTSVGDSSALPHKPIRIPHSVATDGGDMLVLESSVGGSDGADHSLVVYELPPVGAQGAELERPLRFLQEVVLCKNARRPHRVEYHAASRAFYVYMTNPATLVRVRVRDGRLATETECFSLPFMKGTYARSFFVRSFGSAFARPDAVVVTTAAPLRDIGEDAAGEAAPAGPVRNDDAMFITAGPGVISVVNFTATPVKLLKAVSVKPLGFGKGRMNDLQFIDGWWYATSTAPCAVVRFKDLRTMRPYESLTKKLGMCGTVSAADKQSKRCRTGTPYFVTQPEPGSKRLYVPYIFGCSGIVSFFLGPEEGADVRDVRHHWNGGWVEQKEDLAVLGGW